MHENACICLWLLLCINVVFNWGCLIFFSLNSETRGLEVQRHQRKVKQCPLCDFVPTYTWNDNITLAVKWLLNYGNSNFISTTAVIVIWPFRSNVTLLDNHANLQDWNMEKQRAMKMGIKLLKEVTVAVSFDISLTRLTRYSIREIRCDGLSRQNWRAIEFYQK